MEKQRKFQGKIYKWDDDDATMARAGLPPIQMYRDIAEALIEFTRMENTEENFKDVVNELVRWAKGHTGERIDEHGYGQFYNNTIEHFVFWMYNTFANPKIYKIEDTPIGSRVVSVTDTTVSVTDMKDTISQSQINYIYDIAEKYGEFDFANRIENDVSETYWGHEMDTNIVTLMMDMFNVMRTRYNFHPSVYEMEMAVKQDLEDKIEELLDDGQEVMNWLRELDSSDMANPTPYRESREHKGNLQFYLSYPCRELLPEEQDLLIRDFLTRYPNENNTTQNAIISRILFAWDYLNE